MRRPEGRNYNESKQKEKKQKKIHRKAYLYNPYYNQFINIYLMQIRLVSTSKKRFLPLLLLADEQESMIDRYLERGEMFVARDDGQVVAECVVTDEADRIGEIKNLAVPLQYQRKGYGRQTLEFLEAYYRGRYRTLLVGTGDVPRTLRFYERCGYVRSHLIPGFFTDHYDHPIIEDGRQLVDMVYLKKSL